MKVIHTVKEITNGLTKVTLGDLLEIAKKKKIDPKKVFVAVTDSRYTTYRDLELIVATKPKKVEEDNWVLVTPSSKDQKILAKFYKP